MNCSFVIKLENNGSFFNKLGKEEIRVKKERISNKEGMNRILYKAMDLLTKDESAEIIQELTMRMLIEFKKRKNRKDDLV